MRKVLVVVLAGLLTALAGCGIRPTGVLAGGRAAAGTGTGPVLYFVVNGVVKPFQRDIGHLGDATTALSLLFDGPLDAERVAGAASDLPPVPTGAVGSVYADDGSLFITVPLDVRGLSPVATEQIVCTVVGVKAMAGTADPRNVPSVLRGTGGALPPAPCPLFQR